MINKLRDAGHTGLVMQITGEPGTGKTRMALGTGAEYSEMVLINADVKRALVNAILKSGATFGYYRDAIAGTSGMKEIALHKWYLDRISEIEKLPAKSRRVIIIDPWEKFEITLKPMVEQNPRQFRDFWSSMGKFKGPQEWNTSHDYSAALISRLVGLCEILILTSHLKNAYRGGVQVPGKMRPDNKMPVNQKTDIRIWTRMNVSPVPIGLLMKRGLMRIVEGKRMPVNVLPRKLTPKDGEEGLWNVIERYWDEPIGIREPSRDETPNEFELSILEGTLTAEQQYAWEMAVQGQKHDDILAEGERVAEAKAIYEETGSFAEVKKRLGLENVADAMKMVKGE